MKYRLTFIFIVVFSIASAIAQSFDKAKDFQKFNGYFNYYYDDSSDKIYLQVDDLEKEFLYVYSLSSGIGSNDIGLDRGQLGNEQVVFLKKQALNYCWYNQTLDLEHLRITNWSVNL